MGSICRKHIRSWWQLGFDFLISLFSLIFRFASQIALFYILPVLPCSFSFLKHVFRVIFSYSLPYHPCFHNWYFICTRQLNSFKFSTFKYVFRLGYMGYIQICPMSLSNTTFSKLNSFLSITCSPVYYLREWNYACSGPSRNPRVFLNASLFSLPSLLSVPVSLSQLPQTFRSSPLTYLTGAASDSPSSLKPKYKSGHTTYLKIILWPFNFPR